MSLVKYALIVAGLVAIFWAFDRLSIRQFQAGRKKYGDAYRQESDVMKVGYVVMVAYFIAVSLLMPGSGSSDTYDPCLDTGMRC